MGENKRYRPGVCNAAVTGRRAARIAGGIPSTMLMASANPIVVRADAGVSVRRNASSENVLKFIVESVTNCSTVPPPIANRPAKAPSMRDSRRNTARIWRGRNPSALSMPISLVREATAPYIVMVPPRMAPNAKMRVNVKPRRRMKVASVTDFPR